MLPILPELQAIIIELLDPKSFSAALSVNTQWRYTMEHTRIYPQFIKVCAIPITRTKVKIALYTGYDWVLNWYPDAAKRLFCDKYDKICSQNVLASVKWFFESPDNMDVFDSVLKLQLADTNGMYRSSIPYKNNDVSYGIVRYAAYNSLDILRYLYGIIKVKYLDKLTGPLLHVLFNMCCVKGDVAIIDDLLIMNTGSNKFNIFDVIQNKEALVHAAYLDNVEVVNHLFELERLGVYKFTDPERIFFCFISVLRMEKFSVADSLVQLSHKYQFNIDFEHRIWPDYIINLTKEPIRYLIRNKLASMNFFIGQINRLDRSYKNLVDNLIDIILDNGETMDNQLLINLLAAKQYSVVDQFIGVPQIIANDNLLEIFATNIKQNLDEYIKHGLENTIIYLWEKFGMEPIENTGNLFMQCIKYFRVKVALYLIKYHDVTIYVDYLATMTISSQYYYDKPGFDELIRELQNKGFAFSPEFLHRIEIKQCNSLDAYAANIGYITRNYESDFSDDELNPLFSSAELLNNGYIST